MKNIFKITLLFFLITNVNFNISAQEIIPGAYRINDLKKEIEGKKIGVVANHSSIIINKGEFVHLVDSLIDLGLDIKKIFSPEHGFKGDRADGELIKDDKYRDNIDVISLYGSNKEMKFEDINDLDIIIFDIQDVGVRYYTYLSTLHYTMEAVAKADKRIIVLDRPNPNSHYIDGPVLDLKYTSFIGLHPVPIVYGMTIGEYALMINGEKWLENGIKAKLDIIKIKNYNHKSQYLPPVPPSPNLPNIQSILLYPSLAFLEKTPVSVGRGTNIQFQIFGHPDFKSKHFSFTPRPSYGSNNPKQKNQICYGDDLREYKVRDQIELKWLIESYKLINNKKDFFFIDFKKLAGNEILEEQIKSGIDIEEIRASWQTGIDNFKKIRSKYLLY
ncbi:MAG: DUF1343 domain-containing protein [Bacteroidota bacterium]|nr:DUF1343 domain-containing protein [Bacteroidota bacterium]|tara:strand:+ start:2814 stop:3974 length:1161 start_codon:yes stop_codon:yes gene_type:complete